jgi:integrase
MAMKNSASLPAVRHGITWDTVSDLGRVLPKRLPSGTIRWWIDFGRPHGRRVRVYSVPSAADRRPIAFANEEMAEQVLDAIRAEVRNGKTLDQVLARYCGRSAPEDMVEARLAEYIDHFEAKVRAKQRSANTLREVRRYSQADGHFSFWFGRSVNGISYGDLEDWHLWLGERGISAKTQKNVSNTFKTVLKWLHRRSAIEEVPEFPAIKTEEHAPRIISIDQQRLVLESIPWERRGAFLVAATEALRMSEIRALDLDDYQDGKLYVGKAVQGPRVAAPVRSTKTRSAEWRELWSEELIEWLEWRLEQATSESRLRGEIALFWNPAARNTAKRWMPDPLERLWNRACKDAIGFSVGFQEGTRHSFLTALAQGGMSERMLRAFSRHRDGRSLDHYAKPKATPEAIVKVLRPGKANELNGEHIV